MIITVVALILFIVLVGVTLLGDLCADSLRRGN
jgi:hypothetical protein